MKKLAIFLLLCLNAFSTELVRDLFEIDLNLDDKKEKVVLKKKNGLDYLAVLNDNDEKIFEHEITPMGNGSHFQKVTHVILNKLQQCLLVHHQEGTTGVKAKKRSTRLFSFCFATNNLKNMSVQDLGYLFWDYQSVGAYQQLESIISIKNHFIQGATSAVLVLRQDQRTRSWRFNSKISAWSKLPESMYAQYGVKPAR